MSHIHWVARQNKLQTPRDKDEVNKREIHECNGRAHDPDTMVTPLTPNPTRKTEVLVRTPPTIVSRREEDVALRKWSSHKSTRKTEALARAPPTIASRHEEDTELRKCPLPRYCCESYS
jgi:hypothetical protein